MVHTATHTFYNIVDRRVVVRKFSSIKEIDSHHLYYVDDIKAHTYDTSSIFKYVFPI